MVKEKGADYYTEIKINQKDKELDKLCESHNLHRDYSRELVSEQLVKKDLTDLKKGSIFNGEGYNPADIHRAITQKSTNFLIKLNLRRMKLVK